MSEINVYVCDLCQSEAANYGNGRRISLPKPWVVFGKQHFCSKACLRMYVTTTIDRAKTYILGAL